MDQPFTVPQSRIAEVLELASARIMCRQHAFSPGDALQGLANKQPAEGPGGDERTAQWQQPSPTVNVVGACDTKPNLP